MNILVVDDDPGIADVIATSLTMEGHQTRTAYTGSSALRILKEQTPHVLLLDLMMPHISGQEVFEQISQQGKRTHMCIILMSAHPMLVDEARRLHADGFLEKPFNLDDLDALLALHCTTLSEQTSSSTTH